MNGFVKANVDTQNVPGKMFPIQTKTTPKCGYKKHRYLHILKGISLQSKKKRVVAKRDGDRNTNCRLCKKEKESIQHVIASCPKLSVSMHLPLRHDKVAKVIYDAIIDRKNQKKGIVEIYSEGNKEIWWDKKIATIPPLKHNKPDILYWNKHDNICFIIDIAVGLDVNITKNIKLKHDNYMQLSSELKRLYPNFSFEIVPIVLGATGLVTSDLRKNIEKLGIVNINDTLAKCQRIALLGTMKIVKSVMRMKNN